MMIMLIYAKTAPGYSKCFLRNSSRWEISVHIIKSTFEVKYLINYKKSSSVVLLMGSLSGWCRRRGSDDTYVTCRHGVQVCTSWPTRVYRCRPILSIQKLTWSDQPLNFRAQTDPVSRLRNCAGLAYLQVLEAYRHIKIIRNSKHDSHE